MKSECITIKNDQEQIKQIHSKWKNSHIQQSQIGQIKKLQLSFTEQKNLDFQLPDVFVTTKRILTKPQKYKINKKTSFSFETSVNTSLLSKQQRNLELSSLQTKYQKFKDLSCSVRTTPQQDSLNKCQSIPKNQNFYELDGIKFPYGLYSMHKKRRNQIQDMLYNSNSYQKQKKLDNDDQIQITSDQVQKEYKQKEYTSRKFLENAYFSIICANKNCRYRIKIKIRDSHSIKSRYQQF